MGPFRRLLISVVAACALVPAATADARTGQRTLFEAPRELLSADPALRAGTLDEIQGFGVGWLRIVLYWRDVAPAAAHPGVPRFDERDPAGYDFSRYDAAIAEARARGFQILLTVSGPGPRWASAKRDDQRTRPEPARFGRFMTAIGRHYRTVVDHWSIWNEPNHPAFLLPQWTRGRVATSARIYRQLFRAAEAGLDRSGNARDVVLLGEMAPRGTGKVVHPLRFLREVLCLDSRYRRRGSCVRLDADGVAHHAYTTRAGPFFVPPNRDDVTIGVLGRLERAMDRAARAGALRARLPIWLTEFGIQSEPDPYLGVPERTQAEFRSIAERIALRNRRVAAFSQYLMRDDEPTARASGAPAYDGFESGLRNSDGVAKQAYEAFRLPLVALRGRSRTTLWGIARPATGVTEVTIEHNDRGGAWRVLKSVRTTARGAWQTTTALEPRRSYRVRWTAPDGSAHVGPPTRSYRRP